MRARLLPFVAVVVLVSPALLAGSLEKYKNWPNSPQGYFMTNAERAEWKATVKTDADAEAFVQKFLASRGPGFVEDVAKRAEMADKHLTVSGRAGSLTTRGKIIVLLGPPTGLTIQGRDVQNGRSSSLGGITGGGASGGGTFGNTGASVSDMIDASNQSAMSVRSVNDYTFTYAGDKLPGKPAQSLVVVVEVNPGDGSDRINDRKVAEQLDQVFEQVAQARVAAASKTPAPAPKP
jgi:GWxTD domain-containing protein